MTKIGMGMRNLLSRLLGGVDASPRTGSPTAEPPAPSPPPAFDYDDDRIPDGARAKAQRILASIEEVERAMVREQVPSFGKIDTTQMRDVHLPQLLQSYIDVPAAHRDVVFKRTGKSASFHLGASLDKLQERLDTMLRDLAEHDIGAFTDNMRFINQRYSTDEDPFR